MNTAELESVVDAYPGINLRKPKTLYEALYETKDGKHLAIERRSKSQFKLYLESGFDPKLLVLSTSAVVNSLSKDTKRIHLSSERLAGPYNGKAGSEAWLLRLSSEQDLRKVLQSYFGNSPATAAVLAQLEVASLEKIQDENDESSFAEGTVKYEMHRKLERDSALARRAKANRLEKTGKLQCEVCDFDFFAIYGSLGDGFIEAHHTNPVSTLDGATKTILQSLAIVCSNCHRMLHRSNPLLTPAALKEQIGTRQA